MRSAVAVPTGQSGVSSYSFAVGWEQRRAEWEELRADYLWPLMRWLAGRQRHPQAVDLGCGTGESATEVLGRTESVRLMDLNPHLIRQATQRTEPREAVCGDIVTGIPWTDLDLVLCASVLMFLDDAALREAVQQMSRCLSAQGRAIVGVVDPRWSAERIDDGVPRFDLNAHRHELSWDGVDASLFVRPLETYEEAFSRHFHVREVVGDRVAGDIGRYGPRFSGRRFDEPFKVFVLEPRAGWFGT